MGAARWSVRLRASVEDALPARSLFRFSWRHASHFRQTGWWVYLSPPGGGITAFVVCKSAIVNNVRLSTLDEPTRALWEIRRREGAPSRYDFQVGIAPAGYWTAHSLQEGVPATLDLDLRITVAVGKDAGRIPISVFFRSDRLRAGRFLNGHGQSLAPADFRRVALKAC
jgi:hypothetical protein